MTFLIKIMHVTDNYGNKQPLLMQENL